MAPVDDAVNEILDSDGVKIDTIVYVPDGSLRYIPLPALYDGTDWVARKFAVSILTATSLTDFSNPAGDINSVLAGAFSEDRTISDPSGNSKSFSGLPHALNEVSDLNALFPDSSIHVGAEFKPDNFENHFEDFDVVHLATHGVFVPFRSPDLSYIIFGDGQIASLSTISNWGLRNVKLFVLSA